MCSLGFESNWTKTKIVVFLHNGFQYRKFVFEFDRVGHEGDVEVNLCVLPATFVFELSNSRFSSNAGRRQGKEHRAETLRVLVGDAPNESIF